MLCDQADPTSTGSALEGMSRIGHQEMDSQHLKIFQALQRLGESLRGPFPLETLGARLKQLETLTLDHFREEEELMEQAHYPLLLSHRAEHEFLVERCHGLLDQFSSPGSPPLDQLAEALSVPFARHVQEVDMDYVKFIERKKEEAVAALDAP
jgi:hemerythrin-like metal-binding protein